MPHKPRSKFVDNAMNAPAFKLCNETQHFLAVMNQDCCTVSSFTIEEYLRIVPIVWRSQVMDDLLHMHFRLITPLTAPNPSTPIKVDNNDKDDSEIDELSPVEELTNTIAAFGQWFKSNNIVDNVHPGLVKNIRNLNPAAPPFMRGPPCTPAAQPPAQAQQPVLSKHSKWLFFAMRGPSHRQFFIEVPTISPGTSLPTLVTMANRALAQAKSTLKVDSACLSPRGITCATATVPSTSDLDIVEATLSGGLLRACVTIPASQSFIKIVDIPFFKSSTTDPFTSAEVDAQLQCSIIPANFIANHQLITGCCHSNPKASPPIPPTPADKPCPHVHTCINCGIPHAAMDWHCPYWHHHFNQAWIKDWAIWDTSTRKGVPIPPPTPCGLKPTLHDCTAHPIHWGTAPSLPPVDEEDEVDDDDMEFGHEMDNYDFHE
ncbi:hypothetical protein P691DRAFT_784181 [Macrolepiota fuliginosa MF-IS2]|uniref:Uncharacterized protein n=1 Tax=Macrolepiota fuliginosa MF-IS2 TaxID=1400762 RepID=A0A9P6BVM5_9AGAR|nr:hypothetical protein P691DRAFT_784181 [Macrolepiota fuliginosa MF-IS2]